MSVTLLLPNTIEYCYECPYLQDYGFSDVAWDEEGNVPRMFGCVRLRTEGHAMTIYVKVGELEDEERRRDLFEIPDICPLRQE